MRWATLGLAIVFVLCTLSPCALGAFDPGGAGSGGAAHAPSAHSHDGARSDSAPAAVIKAPCPCGCQPRLPGAPSLGSLGVALLSRVEPPPPAARDARLVPPAARFAQAPPAAIEKVPRAA
jgi:hypothetical protein